MTTRRALAWAAALASGALMGAPPPAAPAARNNFARPPAAAVAALNKTVGKPFSAGYVFIDGHYVKPPYTVERYGTVVRVNGLQVSGEVVPWEEFVKTQSGVTVTKTEAPAAEPPAAAPEPEPEPEAEDDSANSLDDLFDDDPKPKKPARKPAAKPAARPRPKKPAAVVTYSLEGDFAPNERSKALLGQVNAYRTKIDSQLRAGGSFFFSARYSNVSGDKGTSRRIMDRLPEIMKKNSTREAFAQACRQSGLSYFPPSLIEDLFRNRFDYLQLLERRKAEQQETKWQSLLVE